MAVYYSHGFIRTDGTGIRNMVEAGIDGFQEPVERKELFPAFLPLER